MAKLADAPDLGSEWVCKYTRILCVICLESSVYRHPKVPVFTT